MKQDLHLDFETYCDLDLRTVGVHRYVEHPSFRVLCVAWRLAGQGAESAVAGPNSRLPPDLVPLLANPEVQGHAWNAAFETAVLRALGHFVANPLSCTMQRALAYGLPGKLETAGKALGLGLTKDMDGHKLMMRVSRPDKKTGVQPVMLLSEAVRLAAYCATDVLSEEAIGDVIPQFGREEAILSRVDGMMNTSGIGLDDTRVGVLASVAAVAAKADAARCTVLTGGDVTSPGTQTARLLLWLRTQGLALPDVSRSTIEEALLAWQGTANGAVISEVLQIRLRAARGSVTKLKRMLDMSGIHRLLQGQFQFCGAGRTGRWAGRGVQVQNLPRVPKGFSPDDFFALAKASMSDPAGLDAIAPGPVLDCVSWSLRSCLQARDPAHVLWGFDFSQIEARVLAWLAGQQDVLSVFRAGTDIYVWAAGQFGSDNRQLGKVLILALGFGMGAAKLQETARKQYGVTLTAGQAELFKSEWRTRNHHIVNFWYAMENAAKQAILSRGRVFAVGGSGVAFQCTQRTLQMRLPSGRVLYYHKPRLDQATGHIVYWGVGLGNLWSEQHTYGGKLAENATQAVARDIMGEAMLRIWRREGIWPMMTVHDELVYEIASAMRTVNSTILQGLALEAPTWAGGLPIAGETKLVTRYGVPI